jgi:hypothetical protein
VTNLGKRDQIFAGNKWHKLAAISLIIIIAATSITALVFLNMPSRNGEDEFGPFNPPSIFTISQPVLNDFECYIPFDESFSIDSPYYTVESELSNIVNLNSFSLSGTTVELIEQNGFAVISSQYSHIHDILQSNEDNSIPSFVSSDAVLHAFHVVYDLALREIEVYSFWDILWNLTKMLMDVSLQQYNNLSSTRWKGAALRNLMFFSVAMSLLDNETQIYSEIQDEVNQVLSLINNHNIISGDWFMRYWEDFTQYKPRGHYTRSELLGRYFKAMMWYGRIMFRLYPNPNDNLNEQGKNETAQSILISLALDEQVDGLPSNTIGYDAWDALYQPTAFLVSASDDLTPPEIRQLVTDIHGDDITPSTLDNEALLNEFIIAADSLHDPLILSSAIPYGLTINETKGMRFMGQRFIPDSYILWQLVYSNVGNIENPRLMPMGLDVMAALGSDRAWELLDDQKEYVNYISQMQKLWNEIGNMSAEEWTRNVYYLWLYSLLPLLSQPGEGYPLFMQSDAWVDKQLMTALGSWTELRHDTILYAKQSYTAPTAISIDPETAHGYVEPLPRLYGRLASLCNMTRHGLNHRSLLSNIIESKLSSLYAFLLSLKAISLKELIGDSLTSDEIELIRNSGDVLEAITELPTDDLLVSEADEKMALIADVHTDPNTEQVLEEAIGNPMIIYVAVLINGQVVLTRGGTFSYYEFAQPMSNRLTDEEWQDMLDAGEEPAMPSWTISFIVEASSEFYCIAAPFRKIE